MGSRIVRGKSSQHGKPRPSFVFPQFAVLGLDRNHISVGDFFAEADSLNSRAADSIRMSAIPSGETKLPDAFSKVLQRHLVCFGLNDRGEPIDPPRVPLCRMLHMDLVRSLQVTSGAIDNLVSKFKTNGYVEDLSKFYLSTSDANGQEAFVTDDIRDTWDDVWAYQSDVFDNECSARPEFEVLQNRMFSVLDGNHRLYSWMRVSSEFPTEERFHPRVVGRFLKGSKESLIEIETAMHELNK